ncbi:MAG: ATP-binding protein [Elusimicrobiota bacterium]|jgi:hypothetical protein|nr:ATP-binding protein [Elusimicrobiota bacterium]
MQPFTRSRNDRNLKKYSLKNGGQKMKELPIGIQSFKDLRKNPIDYLYIDKTPYIYEMSTKGKIYFLSRPRRFGKSLLISAIDELFSGNNELFEGLYIYDKWDWNKKYPVIRIDFGSGDYSSNEKLKDSLADFLKNYADKFNVILENSAIPTRFAELIQKVSLSAGGKVVVLVDEYDKPILDNVLKPKIQKENRDTLHDFYQVLKASDDHLKFIFLTGVSKFVGLSIFSALNNIFDMTIGDEFAGICGYTQQELEYNFSEHIDSAANKLSMGRQELLDNIAMHYDGYSWDGKTRVYNPFSILMFFRNQIFDFFWYRTATPTFLMDIIKNKSNINEIIEPQTVGSSFFSISDVKMISVSSLLFQTGYLTIKDSEIIKGIARYNIGIPNNEVKDALLNNLFKTYSDYPSDNIEILRDDMRNQIEERDETGFEKNLKMLFAYIPYTLNLKYEKSYHALFLITMKLLGFDIDGESLTNLGRIDAVMKLGAYNVIAEFKYSAKKSIKIMLAEAMKQIKNKKYYEKYTDRPIIFLAIAFKDNDLKCKFVQFIGK